jgi:hypothetical protein
MANDCITMRQYINVLGISGKLKCCFRLRRSVFAHAEHELQQFIWRIWLCNTCMNGSSYTNPCNWNGQMNPYRTNPVQSSLFHTLDFNSFLNIHPSSLHVSVLKRALIFADGLLKSLSLSICLSVRM